ncbi:MAG: bifunctional phosphoribosylaminoimidazolecarboxamide formyltransferase/IMP cyclohydrolase [Planctomycetota bacterium]|nr:bifunctional phosphoribosylaminoimidazolecarboxamide formyltransferase/IMP cyclohydrolase [Planctomycetota bacterium]
MTPPTPIRRALLSVSDKADLVPFAQALAARGVTIISTGGTAKALAAAGVPVVPVETVTGFPEGLDGRVKTLHPAVHAGLLALRDRAEHTAFLKQHRFEPIDLVCINLYPFQRTVADPNVSMADAIENIDVGGPAMLRAAAKNARFVTVVTSPRDYDRVIQEMDAHGGSTTPETRAQLAAAAFARTAEYDAAIASFLGRRQGAFPQVLDLRYTLVDQLRYGENPHQQAALYRDPASTGQSVVNAQQLHGKHLSYNNINDAAAALEAVKALARIIDRERQHAAVVVKHTNPCGGAVASALEPAVDAAIAGDPVAAYGGILAVSSSVDAAAARVIARESHFFEVVIAPAFDDAALDVLRERWANVRLLAVGDKAASSARKLDYRSVPGGMLVQDRDLSPAVPERWELKAGPKLDAARLAAAALLEVLCRSVTSNAIVVGGPDPARPGVTRLFGVGSGQVDRVSACRLALAKAGDLARGAIAVGDAFFPFDDGPRLLIDAGVTTLVHPGGSKRDADTIALCTSRGVTCLHTGTRHFRH